MQEDSSATQPEAYAWPPANATVLADPRPLFIDQLGAEKKIVWASGIYAFLIVLQWLPNILHDSLLMALSLLALIVPNLIAYLVLNIYFMVWVYGITKNLAAFRTAGKIASPGWAVAYYFIPFAAFVAPYLNMADVWKASNPDADSQNQEEWRGGASSGIVRLWWAMNMLAVVIFWLIAIFGYREAHTHTATHPLFDALSNVGVVVDLTALYVVCRLVKVANDRQLAKEHALRSLERSGL